MDFKEERFNRNCLALGRQGQIQLQDMNIAAVGIGGHGYNLSLMLAHLGIGSMTLIDDDKAEDSNLNRLLGLSQNDVGKKKVKILKKYIRKINPNIAVKAIPYKADHPKAISALKSSSLIIGAVDSENSRLFMNGLSVQYLIPFIDLGCGIESSKDGDIEYAGGQIRFVIPGITPCLICINGINLQRARQETLSTSELQGEIARGYVQGFNIPQPSIISLNLTICSLACTQILFFSTGLHKTDFYLYYDFLNQRLEKIDAKRSADCIVCSPDGILGKGDILPIRVNNSGSNNNYPFAKSEKHGDTG